VDTTAPTISDVPDATVECTGSTAFSATGEPTASDICGSVTITHSDSAQTDQYGNTGSFVRTWTATDACGNTAQSTQTITIVDTTAPRITPQPDVTVSAVGCTATNLVLVAPSVADNCSVASVASNAPAVYPLGTNVVTWIVVDGSGNTSIATQRVIV